MEDTHLNESGNTLPFLSNFTLRGTEFVDKLSQILKFKSRCVKISRKDFQHEMTAMEEATTTELERVRAEFDEFRKDSKDLEAEFEAVCQCVNV